MSDPQAGSSKPADSLEQWRELRDTYVDIWAKASGEAVNSEAYAQASGTMLEAFLATSSPFRDAQKKAMVSALEQCNMPSRDDYVRLADRLANLELLLDDMDARLRQVHQIRLQNRGAARGRTEGFCQARAHSRQGTCRGAASVCIRTGACYRAASVCRTGAFAQGRVRRQASGTENARQNYEEGV